jgi:integrase/recombinase XerD
MWLPPTAAAAVIQSRWAAPTVKQHLAAIRMLFDWLVTGQVVPPNPAHSVRGPRYSVSKGSTPVLSSEEATALLQDMNVSTVVGLRDRAIIAVMTYSFARVGAVVTLAVEDYFPQKKRWWLRLHEKNGKLNEMPCHHKLESHLDTYIDAAGIRGDRRGPLFRSTIGKPACLRASPCPASISGAWYGAARRMPTSKPPSAVTAPAPPASQTTSPTAAASKSRNAWPAMPTRRRRAFMIAATMTSA